MKSPPHPEKQASHSYGNIVSGIHPEVLHILNNNWQTSPSKESSQHLNNSIVFAYLNELWSVFHEHVVESCRANNSPGGFETKIPQWQLQESAALAQGQILRRSAVDVMYDIQVSQTAFCWGYGSWDDVFHVQYAQPTVTSSIENQTYKRQPHTHPESKHFKWSGCAKPYHYLLSFFHFFVSKLKSDTFI